MSTANGGAPRQIFEVGEVFVAGGMPTVTYNPRNQLNLEGHLRDALKRLNKIILVVGATKSGKTVLVRRVLPLEDAVWVEGGAIREEDDFWQEIVNQLGISLETSTIIGETSENGTQNEASVGAKPLGIGAEGKRTASSKAGASRQDGFKRVETARSASLRVLKERKLTLVVDDFHYCRASYSPRLCERLNSRCLIVSRSYLWRFRTALPMQSRPSRKSKVESQALRYPTGTTLN
jgi:hypothetical protein